MTTVKIYRVTFKLQLMAPSSNYDNEPGYEVRWMQAERRDLEMTEAEEEVEDGEYWRRFRQKILRLYTGESRTVEVALKPSWAVR